MDLSQFPGPWKVVQIHGGYAVEDARGRPLAWIYCYLVNLHGDRVHSPVSPMEAHELARQITLIPERGDVRE